MLFDQFEDGSSVLGGAPFNVAWHLQGLGMRPLFISRVGQDEAGEQVLASMHEWGMDTRGVQIDPKHPTGKVRVRLKEGQATFEIVPEQAYDFINPTLAVDLVHETDCSLLYYGTLAAREQGSRAALQALRSNIRRPVFVDVNLRPPWWDHGRVTEALQGARWVKLNEAELAAEILQRPPIVAEALEGAAHELLDQHGLAMVVLTLGSEGACIVTGPDVQCHAPPPLEGLVDTVGAGDAFSAATIYGLHEGWGAEAILERALEFAAAICRRRGATHRDADLYRSHLENWVA